jgi:hypothetical protein
VAAAETAGSALRRGRRLTPAAHARAQGQALVTVYAGRTNEVWHSTLMSRAPLAVITGAAFETCTVADAELFGAGLGSAVPDVRGAGPAGRNRQRLEAGVRRDRHGHRRVRRGQVVVGRRAR